VSAMEMVRPWLDAVKFNLLPTRHGHQGKALALFSWAMAVTGSCWSGPVAARVPGAAAPASARRRLERALANDRLDATAAMLELTGSLLRDWGGCGRPLLLILDETPKGNDLRCMKLSVAYRKRTVTLLAVCYAPDRPPMPMPRLVRWMLRQVAPRVPDGADVTLLADRGLCWPTLIRCCRRLRWHYLLRLQCDTRVRPEPDDKHMHKHKHKHEGKGKGKGKHEGKGKAQRELAVRELAPHPGARWFGPVRIFKRAHWLRGHVAAVWEADANDPWLLVTDEPATYRGCCRRYCKRTWCEETHRDEKSHGLNWQRSRVNDPGHAQRLVLLIALATLLCVALGAAVIKRGLRHLFEPRRRRMLSVFQLGMRRLGWAVTHDQPLCPLPSLPPP
jgi:hypothetical protein